MGLPGKFVGWVRAIYGEAKSRIMVRGFLGERGNVGKSMVLVVGSWGDLGRFGLRVESERMKVLGVIMDGQGKGKEAQEKVEGRVKGVVGLWGTQDLSFRGKVQVIKQCLLPLIYRN